MISLRFCGMMGWLLGCLTRSPCGCIQQAGWLGAWQNRASVSRWYIHSRFHSIVSVPPSKRRKKNLANLLNLEVRREILLVKKTKQPALTQGRQADPPLEGSSGSDVIMQTRSTGTVSTILKPNTHKLQKYGM